MVRVVGDEHIAGYERFTTQERRQSCAIWNSSLGVAGSQLLTFL
jgi:hypothetical protein